MDAAYANRLIDRYTQGWLKSDSAAILDTLDENCEIIESHGSTYKGKGHVSGWLEGWKSSRSSVTKWDILSFVFDGQKSAVEWDFECITRGKAYRIRGMSWVEFRNEKIYSIHEYCMTNSPYAAPAVYE